MNQITVNFVPCDPAPANGYNVIWRPYGSNDQYVDAGNFFVTPAVFNDNDNPDGTDYEGFIRSDITESGESGSNYCTDIAWNTFVESGDSPYAIELVGECIGIYSSYQISGGTPGDIVTVRASFGGLLAKIGQDMTRADLGISSPVGTSDTVSSACYEDIDSHGFTITADTVITMVGTTATINLSAVVHNSNEGSTNVGVTIIDINGTPHFISVVGCKGNSSTAGNC